jgi:hypothetical protein
MQEEAMPTRPSPSAPRRGQERRDPRTLTLLLVGRIVGERTDGLCRVRNISAGGLMAEVFTRFETGDAVQIELRNGRSVSGRVRWTKEGGIGVQFDERVEDLRQILAEPRPAPRRADIQQVRAPRLVTDCSADIQRDGHHHHAVVANLSQRGARLVTATPLEPDQLLTLAIAGLPPVSAAVRWAKDGEAGLSFLTPLAFATLARWLDDPALRYNRRG